MGAFSFASFIITSIILTNEFGGIDAGRPQFGAINAGRLQRGRKSYPPAVDWRSKQIILKIHNGALASCVV